jgi:hypothetical protein
MEVFMQYVPTIGAVALSFVLTLLPFTGILASTI